LPVHVLSGESAIQAACTLIEQDCLHCLVATLAANSWTLFNFSDEALMVRITDTSSQIGRTRNLYSLDEHMVLARCGSDDTGNPGGTLLCCMSYSCAWTWIVLTE